jgi:crotonobetainyl-CoA:carnitine CoA-transferase CaiB-like acyl-CoA transferase
VPILPIEMDGRRFGTRRDVPKVGEHTRELLAGLGYEEDAIRGLFARNVVAAAA